MGMLTWTEFSTGEYREVTDNPYCGFYTVYRFYAHDDLLPDWNCPLEELRLDKTQSLCLLEINLAHYRDRPLTEDSLRRIERIFSWFKEQKKEMIVRFLYDWDGKGLEYEPQEMGIILLHMEQLEFLLLKYSKNIYILQGLFIGSWGEMHSSRYLDECSLTTLAHKLYACSGQDTFIALRCPSMWRTVFRTYKPLSESQAYGNNMQARFGLYNDGLLASETDNGTYGTVTRNRSTKYSDKLIREEELVFQERLCRFVPNGGETVNLSFYHKFKRARNDLATMHVSYLNGSYDPIVLNKWKETKIRFIDPFWESKSIYNYMASHLGYRFFVEKIKVTGENDGKRICVELQILNRGFSGTYRPFDVALSVQTQNFASSCIVPAQTDTRYWFPDVPITLVWRLNCADWKDGIYILGLKIMDPFTTKSVGLANNYPLGRDGIHSLGCLKFYAGGRS
ncbi:MAG TPA: DUF4832 domain-containing protein [Oscillospiraceae bacterium]|nr:DUF4832 domain-containing protein [Oscillospiraceae bacterium]